MYCTSCGNEIHEEAIVCMKCGSATKNSVTEVQLEGDLAFAWGFLGFFLPLPGIVLYFVWKSTRPKSAKACIVGALLRIGLIVLIYGFIFFIAILDSM